MRFTFLLMVPQNGQSSMNSGFLGFLPYIVIICIIILGIYLLSKRRRKPSETGDISDQSFHSNFNNLNNQRKCIIITAVIGILSSFLPQYSVNYSYSANNEGVETALRSGMIFFSFIIFGIPILMSLIKDVSTTLKRGKLYFAIIPPAIFGILMLMGAGQGSNEPGKLGSNQFGYYLVMLAAITIPIIGLLYKSKDKKPSTRNIPVSKNNDYSLNKITESNNNLPIEDKLIKNTESPENSYNVSVNYLNNLQKDKDLTQSKFEMISPEILSSLTPVKLRQLEKYLSLVGPNSIIVIINDTFLLIDLKRWNEIVASGTSEKYKIIYWPIDKL